MLTHWNTGRAYSTEGQKLIAEVKGICNGCVEVIFHDKTRGIAGRYTSNANFYQTEAGIHKFVMERYDSNNYEGISPSEAKHLENAELTEMKPRRQRARIGYVVGKKEYIFYWEILQTKSWDDVTTQGFKEAKRRHKSARSFWYTEYQAS